MRCPLRVEQLSFLSRRNPTVGSPTNLERRKTLSHLKCENKPSASHFPFFLSTFSFPLFLPFCFSFFFSFLLSHFPFIFSSFSILLWSFSLPFWSNHSFGQNEEISSPFPLIICVAINFPSLFFYFFYFFMTSSLTWLNMSHGIMPSMWFNVSHSFLCQVSHS